MTTTSLVKERIQLVRDLSNEMALFLRNLPDNVWKNANDYASACEKWTIADVVTHLILGAGTFERSIRNALRGDISPPMGYSKPSSEAEATTRLVETRASIYEDIFYDFNTACLRFNSLVRSLNPENYSLPAWHPLFTITVADLINIRASELAIHGWDVRYPIDRSSMISDKAIPFQKNFLKSWLRMTFSSKQKLNKPITYRFNLTDTTRDVIDLVYSGDDFTFPSVVSNVPDVIFSCDSNTYILLCMGRIKLERYIRRGTIVVDGDESLAKQFTTYFTSI